MTPEQKRRDEMTPGQVQDGNYRWWSSNPMTYDWRGEVRPEPLSLPWFDAIDQRFIHGSRLFATRDKTFDRMIPLAGLRGKKVLEIGCGMGLHTETMAAAGAQVTAIDLTPTAVNATSTRLRLKGLHASVHQIDAEHLPFNDAEFDFVWSWGVIHHSGRTARIVREIARVLSPEGSCCVMVYNRTGMPARLALWKDHLLKARFLRQSFEETLFRSTDGFSARFYVKEQFEDLFRAYFQDVSSEICGQDADVIPLPAWARKPLLKCVSTSYLERAQARRGAFLFLKAKGKE
jgi:2-polyprenyl-3-methyl-5-hydroxy-6-metoxy-1,4-benzoquinol methylase